MGDGGWIGIGGSCFVIGVVFECEDVVESKDKEKCDC